MRPVRTTVLLGLTALLAGCGEVAADAGTPPPTLTAATTAPTTTSSVPPTQAWYTTEPAPYVGGHATPETPYSTATATGCPPGGLTYAVGFTDAAMGLRVTGLTVKNCGSAVRTVKGYPDLTVVDEFQRPLDVTVEHGEAAATGMSSPRPSTFRLEPGQELSSALSWRSTVTLSEDDRSAKAGGVRLTSGKLEQMFMAYLDIGSTGDVYVSAWDRPATE
ncbi:DUF4232 domain-containing protein [Kineosporia sp. NBRC 101731]|uniref:DUF4232 domain-containing protein n=1 Tax=Kineosporia sp. NBRC 101731 TaxID=3032199 RepID=UPI002554A909|nr:DUF4232 domain-containing protein [Kineosporia sp. NBRC 101731]